MKEQAPPIWEPCALTISGSMLSSTMRIIAKSTLRAFWTGYPDAEAPLLAWYREVEKSRLGEPSAGKGAI